MNIGVVCAEVQKRRACRSMRLGWRRRPRGLRPVLMTTLVASLGFLPMGVQHGDGAERVQRPAGHGGDRRRDRGDGDVASWSCG